MNKQVPSKEIKNVLVIFVVLIIVKCFLVLNVDGPTLFLG